MTLALYKKILVVALSCLLDRPMQIAEPITDTTPATLDAALKVIAALTHERDLLRASHERLRLELELLRRRIFVAKAERVDTSQLELEFAKKLAELDKLSGRDELEAEAKAAKAKAQAQQSGARNRKKPTGRRDLTKAPLEEERVELKDPLFEELVAQGKAKFIGFEESSKLAFKRGGLRRLVVARAKYQAQNARGESELETTPMPKEVLPRSFAAPSLLAHVATAKHCEGLPLFRLEDRFLREGFSLDRGTMCRWLEDMGSTLGTTVVLAMRKEALSTSFCIATDATGVAVQPEPLPDNKRQPCRRGHFFVLIADRDHILFEYTPKETSKFVSSMLHGYSGYVQADAKSVYDILFREPEEEPPDGIRTEVGCWSHCRRGFWEATAAKSAVAREGLVYISRIFEMDARFRGKAPAQIKELRSRHLQPLLDAFFPWVEEQWDVYKDERGLLRSALGYARNQKEALKRVLEDGRLVLDNNRSELQARRIAVGRKAWLFVGSDDHGVAAGHLFSLIASARLHKLDPEAYLRDVIRVLPHWPRERHLELCPKYWAHTRARLDADELAQELGPLTVPVGTPNQPVS
jgi:transposase